MAVQLIPLDLICDWTPFQEASYSITHSQYQNVKVEINKLVKLEILKPVSDGKWAYPCVVIKKLDSGIRFLTYFRVLNGKWCLV